MIEIDVAEAAERLEELYDRVVAGEDFVIVSGPKRALFTRNNDEACEGDAAP